MFEEYIGKKYGKMKIVRLNHINKNGEPIFDCQCDCGSKNFQSSLVKLESGKNICQCSCKRDLTGKRFGRLLVVKLADRKDWKILSGKSRVTFHCVCDCGTELLCPSIFLTTKKQVSCGCINKEKQHFACKSQIHRTWSTMMTRCYNPKRKFYYLYGGRGITVCQEWIGSNPKGFANFYDWSINNGYKEEVLNNGRNKLTLDRIDCDKGYSPENCRWITNEEQQNNKRADKLFEYNGECKTIKLWLKQYFVKCNDYYRLARLGLTNKNILDFVSSKHQIDINSKIGKGDRYKYTNNQSSVYDRITNKIWNKCDFLCSCTNPTHPYFSTED